MKRKHRQAYKKKDGWFKDPEIEKALLNLKALANSPGDRLCPHRSDS